MPSNRRNAMIKQLVEALFLHGRIRTTIARAKETRPVAERVITWAKRGGLHHRRMAMALISRKDVVNRVFDSIVEWYKERPGGYTRIIHIGPRPGDAADMAFLELVDWVSTGEKLPGQNVKAVKVAEGEGEQTDKEKKEKAKQKKLKKEAAKPVVVKKKTVKSPEQLKRIAERNAEQDKVRKAKASVRDKAKQEQQAKRGPKPEVEKKAKPVVKKTEKPVKEKKEKKGAGLTACPLFLFH
jgi:large subunit ribosomal protein L17